MDKDTTRHDSIVIDLKPKLRQVYDLIASRGEGYITPTEIGVSLGKPKESAASYAMHSLKALIKLRIIEKNNDGQYRKKQ